MKWAKITHPDQLITRRGHTEQFGFEIRRYAADVSCMEADEMKVLLEALRRDIAAFRQIKKRYHRQIGLDLQSALEKFDYVRNPNRGSRDPQVVHWADTKGVYYFICLTPIAFDLCMTFWVARQLPTKTLMTAAETIK